MMNDMSGEGRSEDSIALSLIDYIPLIYICFVRKWAGPVGECRDGEKGAIFSEEVSCSVRRKRLPFL